MKLWIRTGLVALVLTAMMGVSADPVVLAQATPAPARRQSEKHPAIQRAMRQLEGVKDELQKAPDDFHGHKEAAIDALEQAYRNGEGNDIYVIKVDPLLDGLRGHPRFEALAEKIVPAREFGTKKSSAEMERRQRRVLW